MNLELLSLTITVFADAHNPSILHPVFLRSRNIVPQDWEPEDDQLSSRAVSMVRYENGIALRADPARFAVSFDLSFAQSTSPSVEDIAERYVQELPHVPYTGVAVSHLGVIERDVADAFLVERLVHPEARVESAWAGPPRSVDITLEYSRGDVAIDYSLEIETGTLEHPVTEKKASGIICTSNFFQETSTPEQIVTFIHRQEELQRAFVADSKQIAGTKAE